MRIAYFLNSLHSINWGGQATSSGIKLLAEQSYPHAEFVPLKVPTLPKKWIRNIHEPKLAAALLNDDLPRVESELLKLGIPQSLFDGFDTVCFNGEGKIHTKSGHLIRAMGMLYSFKHKGAFVSALNQTIDLTGNNRMREVVAHVYRKLDYVAAREPVSVRELTGMGVKAELVPDAAYALPRLTPQQIEQHTKTLDLPDKFIGVTASSALKKTSVSVMDFLLTEIQNHYHLPIVFLANAKTDIALAKKLSKKHQFTIIQPPVKYEQAMAVIAKAHLIIGGRQHPNIFAAMHHVPFIPLAGNTHKMQGVVELLNYPLKTLPWEKDSHAVQAAFHEADRLYDQLRTINAPHPSTICLHPTDLPS